MYKYVGDAEVKQNENRKTQYNGTTRISDEKA